MIAAHVVMPRATSTKNKPGTERYRDERRKGGGPRMHGRDWHDHEQPKEFEPEVMAAITSGRGIVTIEKD